MEQQIINHTSKKDLWDAFHLSADGAISDADLDKIYMNYLLTDLDD